VPVVCHLGDALSRYVRDPGGAHALLKQVADAGYHGVRAWTVLTGDYWAGREVGPETRGYWGLIEDFRGALRHHGLRWLVSQGDLMRAIPGSADRRAFMRRLASLLTLDDLAGVDAGNETWQNGEGDEGRLQDAIDGFLDVLPAPVWSLTSPPGEETEELLRYAGSVADVHTYRDGRWWDKVRHVWNNAFEGVTDRPVVQSEPFGPGARVSVTANKGELDEGVMQAAAVAAAMTGQLWVYFSGPGVISDEGERLQDMPGFVSTPAVLALLPKDVGQGEVAHGGDRFAGQRVFVASPRGDARELRWEHTFLGGKRFVALGYAPKFSDVEASFGAPARSIVTDTVMALGRRALLVVGRTTD
jgi:hypothetical protein